MISAREALDRLMEGNRRFVADLRDPNARASGQQRRGELVARQEPFAIILGCSDSRVPAEIVFDQGLGDLFVIRVAGNVACIDEAGSIEYAVNHLGVPLVMVLGHDGCGAVTAVIDHPEGTEPKELEHLLGDVRRGIGQLNQNDPMRKRIRAGVEANVRYHVELLRRNSGVEKQPDGRQTLFVGAVYDVETGRVRVLEDDGVQRVTESAGEHRDH